MTPDIPPASNTAGNLITASGQTDLDQLFSQLTAARSAGDQAAISQILAQIENLAGAVSGTAAVPAAKGTATISQYPVNPATGLPHFSIEVNAGGQSLATEYTGSIVQINQSVNPILTRTVQLPNGGAAIDYMNSMIGTNPGPYNTFSNSCLSYCGNVLNAGGLDVPLNSTSGTAKFLRSLEP